MRSSSPSDANAVETHSMPASVAFWLDNVPEAECFALVDAARGPAVWELLRELPVELCKSLYEERDHTETLVPFSPHLVAVTARTRAELRELWGKSCLTYVIAPVELRALRKHFRHFLIVRAEGKKLYFRFYDPRVLPMYLRHAEASELATFLGQIHAVVCEANAGRAAWRFVRDPASEVPALVHALLER